MLRAGDLVATANGLVAGLALGAQEILVNHVVDERALAGTADAGDATEDPERQIHVDVGAELCSRAPRTFSQFATGVGRRAGSGIGLCARSDNRPSSEPGQLPNCVSGPENTSSRRRPRRGRDRCR